MPLTSIIIATRNRAANLRQTLDALNAIDIPDGMTVELIIADNASTDETPAVARDARLARIQVRYVIEPQPGKSHALNRGVAAAAGELLVFTDDDIVPDPDWLGKLCAPILSGAADGVVGCVRPAPHLDAPWMTSLHRNWLAETRYLDPVDPKRLIGANMVISRKVFERIPLFDVELGPGALGYGEETLLSLQMTTAGFRLASAFDAVVVHHFDPDRLESPQWINAARKFGQVDAYTSYHWENSVWPNPVRMVCSASFHVLRHRLLALFNRSAPVPTEQHLIALRTFHAARQYLREARRPRNYTKYGLVKLAHPSHDAAGKDAAAQPPRARSTSAI